MVYTAWSVIAGEQPTTAKWNILGANDAAMADGTGIGAGVITSSHIANGTLTDFDMNIQVSPVARTKESGYDYIASGCVWSADSPGTNRNASMTAGVVYILGNRCTVAAVTARTFAASNDTYIDYIDNGNGTASPNYSTVANNAASPALTAGRLRGPIIVAAAGNIASAASINQGEEDRLVPIASSTPYAVTDSLGNLIANRKAQPGLIGYRQILADINTASTVPVAITGLSVPVLVPAGRKVRVRVVAKTLYNDTASKEARVSIWDGVVGVGTQIAAAGVVSGAANVFAPLSADTIRTVAAAGLKTYNAGWLTAGGSTSTMECGPTYPAYISVELV